MAKLNHVFGNYFSLAIPLVKRTRTVIDGEETDIDTAYTPSPSELVNVRLLRHKGKAFSYIPTVEGSQVTIEDEGRLPLGTYDVEVTITGGEHPMRFCDIDTIEVHHATEAAGIVPGDTLTATTYTLKGAVFFRMGEGSTIGGVTEQWVTDNFQPKGNYLTREQFFAATLREMMAIDVRPPHRYQAATVPIAYTVDSNLCLAFYDLGQRQCRNVVFKVRRLGASWQEVEDAVEAAGYEIVRHEMVLLRKGKRKKHMRKNDEGEDMYVRKMKRGYSPLLNDKITSPLEGLVFSEDGEADVSIKDFILFNDYPIEECTETEEGSFINISRERTKQDFRMDVWFFGHHRHSLSFGYITKERVFKGQTYIDCAIAEMVEVKGHRRFYGKLVYGRLYLTVSPIVDYSAYDDVEDKVLTLSFVPRDAVASG